MSEIFVPFIPASRGSWDVAQFNWSVVRLVAQHCPASQSSKEAARAADDFLTARTRPSRKLLEHKRSSRWARRLHAPGRAARGLYEVVRAALSETRRSNTKKVVIVTGEPGTGESVIAVAILGDDAKRGYAVTHATGSRSFTTTLRDRVGRRAGNLFRYFNNFTEVEPNGLDVLICDEAHRIRQNSNSRWTARARRSDRSQVDELIAAARVPVFLLDQQQMVKRTSCGCSGCWGWRAAGLRLGRLTTASISAFVTLPSRWKTGCERNRRRGTRPGCR